jgi:hypothetical protein
MHGEKTYPEVVCHHYLGSTVVSIQSKLVVLPSSGQLPATNPEQCHHTQVVDTIQVTQHPVD